MSKLCWHLKMADSLHRLLINLNIMQMSRAYIVLLKFLL